MAMAALSIVKPNYYYRDRLVGCERIVKDELEIILDGLSIVKD